MAWNAQRPADPMLQDTDKTAVGATAVATMAVETATASYVVHGLVAITDGPAYCLCGSTWPCTRRGDCNDQAGLEPSNGPAQP